MKKILVTLAVGAAAIVAAGAASAQTLDKVKQKGFLQCGSNTGLAGFGVPDEKGVWTGLDVDVCRAIAAAIFSDATKEKYVPLSSKDRPQVDLDAVARHVAGPELHRHQLF